MQSIKNRMFRNTPKLIAMTVSALMTGMVSTSVTQASDIEVYQAAKSGDVTLMFMLDISTSMNEKDGGTQSRWLKVQNAMKDLLNGSATVTQLGDDKIIGLSTLGAPGNQVAGAVLIPARRLDAKVMVGTVEKTQRQFLVDKINSLTPSSVTPTARSYAEVIAYFMGVSTKDVGGTLSDGANAGNANGWVQSDISAKTGSGSTATYQSPSSLTQSDEIKKCSGQGVYVLTDGDPNYNNPVSTLATRAIDKAGFSCTNSSDGWDCTEKLNLALLDPDKNGKGLKFKTAVVGFGNSFNKVAAYKKELTQQQNIDLINASSASSNQKKAAIWGVKGEGGWYSGSSSKDVVDSVNEFINSLSTTIPSVTTGSPTVPVDALNPSVLQPDAYYKQFQPTPDKSYQLWLGNLKKYKILTSGKIVDKSNSEITDTNGKIKDNYDYWSTAIDPALENSDENTKGSKKFALQGGAWSQLQMKDTGGEERKLITNRTLVSGGFVNGTNLTTLNKAAFLTGDYKADPERGYLLNLLGYSLGTATATTPTTTNISAATLTTAPELRQLGAVMHSSPLLLTTKGKIAYNATTKKMDSTNREDYVLFGTTQGLLHVVNAKTGKEKFAFVPNEMLTKQKQAFLKNDLTSGGMSSLYYGVDGAWSIYSEYVIDYEGNLTVGSGKGSQKGKLDVYGGLRMGGSSYYALNLANMNSPILKFQISPEESKVYYNGSNTTVNELANMGQSWSKPTITWINWGGTRTKVMFVGGGYDAGYEADDYNQTNKKGGGVYMFDAETGSLLWWASANVGAASTTSATTNSGVIAINDDNLKYSVVSEIRAVDRDGDDLTDHIYFGDLGGQLFRVDFNNKVNVRGGVARNVSRLLNLSANGVDNSKSPRFYDMPSFSLYSAEQGETFAAIAIGSGNRSLPLKDYTTGTSGYNYDAVYTIYDKDVANKNLFNTGMVYRSRNLAKSNLGEVTQANRSNAGDKNQNLVAPYLTKDGWYYQINDCRPAADGSTDCSKYKLQSEKVFGTPLAMNYRLYVSTFDGSKPGISGDCGAGVKGESFVRTFCMPYGQCKVAIQNPDSSLGIGIHTVTSGPKCIGQGCSTGDSGAVSDEELLKKRKEDFNEKSHCIANDGRTAFGSVGAIGEGIASKICLVPQRWYEQLGKI